MSRFEDYRLLALEMSAEDKEKIFEKFVKLIEGKDVRLADRELRQYLIEHCGNDPLARHKYNPMYEASGYHYFYEGFGFREFVRHFDRTPVKKHWFEKTYPYEKFENKMGRYLSHYGYKDLNEAMVDYVTQRATHIYAEMDRAEEVHRKRIRLGR